MSKPAFEFESCPYYATLWYHPTGEFESGKSVSKTIADRDLLDDENFIEKSKTELVDISEKAIIWKEKIDKLNEKEK